MAFVNRKNFEILHEIEAAEYKNEYLQVDELIALPVAILNRKGYKTSKCSSGHPFGSINEVRLSQDMYGIDQLKEMALKYEEAPGNMMRLIMKYDEPDMETYISFRGVYEFETLPEGWEPDANELGWTVIHVINDETEDPLDAFEIILAEVRKAAAWAESLPEYKE